jgi:uncharacterized membrane protein
LIGVGDRPLLMRMLGLREIASGVGILSRRIPTHFMRSRVAGDVMDLALLALAARRARPLRKMRLTGAAAAVAGVTVLDVIVSSQLSRREGAARGAARVYKSIAINRPPDELYDFLRDFENLPRVMTHLEAVRRIDDRRSHWIVKSPAGLRAEWDAEIFEEQPARRLAWRSIEGAPVQSEGVVEFESLRDGRGTSLRIDLQYRVPGGQVGIALAELFAGVPEHQIGEDLRRFKQLMETGEIASAEGPHGRRSLLSRHLP